MNQEEINILAAEFNLTDAGNEAEMFAKALSLCQKFKIELFATKGIYEQWEKEINKAQRYIPMEFYQNDEWQNAILRMAQEINILRNRSIKCPPSQSTEGSKC